MRRWKDTAQELEDEGFLFDRNYPYAMTISPDGTMYVRNTIIATFDTIVERYMLDGTQLSDLPEIGGYRGFSYYNK